MISSDVTSIYLLPESLQHNDFAFTFLFLYPRIIFDKMWIGKRTYSLHTWDSFVSEKLLAAVKH